MKRIMLCEVARILCLVLVLFGLIFVSAIEPGEVVGGEEAEKIQGAIKDLPINPETGEPDFDKYKPFWTKANERIAKVNLWLEENASWLKVVFGIVPSVTWLFAVNLYLWLFFLVLLALNADVTFGSIPIFGEDKMDFGLFYTSWAQLFGLAVFAVIVVLKWVAILAGLILGLFDVVWNYVLPMGFAFAVIAAVLLGIGGLAGIPIALQIIGMIRLKMKERREAKAAAKQALNREVLDKVVEGITED